MRVLCGGEDGVMGVYGGELMPDVRREAENRLVRVDAIYVYPRQRAIVTGMIFERLPLPYGAVVRLKIIAQDGAQGARNEREYAQMIQSARRRLLMELMQEGDWETHDIVKRRKEPRTEISGRYARI